MSRKYKKLLADAVAFRTETVDLVNSVIAHSRRLEARVDELEARVYELTAAELTDDADEELTDDADEELTDDTDADD